MAVSQTPMPMFDRENARETFDAMASKEGRREMMRNHLLEFILPHASHALAAGVNNLFSGNKSQTSAQGGASALLRGAKSAVQGGASQMLSTVAGGAQSQALSAVQSSKGAFDGLTNSAMLTTRDKAASVIHSAGLMGASPAAGASPTPPNLIPGNTSMTGAAAQQLSKVQQQATARVAQAKQIMRSSSPQQSITRAMPSVQSGEDDEEE